MSDLAAGTQEIHESAPLSSYLQPIKRPIVYTGFAMSGALAEEGLISEIGPAPESRDNSDFQDAALTTDETKPHPNTQIVSHASSNRTPKVLDMKGTKDTIPRYTHT